MVRNTQYEATNVLQTCNKERVEFIDMHFNILQMKMATGVTQFWE